MQQEPPSTLYIHSEGVEACSWSRAGTPQASSQPRPLPLPLPLQLLTVLLLSSQPFSWGLGLTEPGQEVHTGALGAHFDLYPQNHYK